MRGKAELFFKNSNNYLQTVAHDAFHLEPLKNHPTKA